MFRRRLFPAAFVLGAALALPCAARAQYGGEGMGSALSSNPMMHQGKVVPGVDDQVSRAQQESSFKIIKDVKVGLKDADPNVRVSELKKLIPLKDPEVDTILVESMADPDIRVKMKAIDILGGRESNAAVPPMSQMLFLRSTEPIVKLHLVAALGRIGDSGGTLPVMQYMEQQADDRARGTAVFALGEIGGDRAVPLLASAAQMDRSPMVRRLAKEALEKIDGEIPTQHSEQLAADKKPAGLQTTDQKLAKLREYDSKIQEQER
ncbi:MAG TPA: HEAT repeat domain-containing protein [Candidatus Binataceae bacterium]|nr:HEAT repeat domain-containing protein [Candidatus Binataceae bacterium]